MNIKNKLNLILKKNPYLLRGSLWRDTYRRLSKFVESDDLILDVGSLKAPYTRYFSNHTIAIDLPSEGSFGFSNEILIELKELKNIDTVIANVEALPFENNYFDKIICTEVLEHIQNPEIAVSEMERVLKPGGKLFITTPNGTEVPLEMGIKEHVYHYSKKELMKLFSNYFGEVHVEKRFHFYNILKIQDKFYLKWDKSDNLINTFFWALMIFLAGWSYDFVYYFEVLFGYEGRYNLVLIAKMKESN